VHPGSFRRRVLLAVSGLSPQIVTETLYALATSSSEAERFVPTEIHVVTTAEGAARIARDLLHPVSGAFHKLCSDYGLSGINFTASHVHPVVGPDGLPLTDIRTADENTLLADAITERVRALTAEEECALHVSLAGGRKTMSFYAGYALSLFGREQDRLSHVLVSEPFESVPGFWYPRPVPEVLALRAEPASAARTQDATAQSQSTVSTAQARVSLATIPFVRLRQGLPRTLLEGRGGFAAAVAAADAAVGPPRLTIDLSRGEITADGQRIRLQPAPFAFYVALVSRAQRGASPLPAPPRDAHDADWAAEVLADLRRAWGQMHVPDKIEDSLLRDCSGSKVSPMVSRLRAALARSLAPGRLTLYFDDGGTHRHKRYGVPLGPGEMEIIPRGPASVSSRGRGGRIGKLADSRVPVATPDTFSVSGHAGQGDDK
jgi:CRISPR-associated protein (TIGR02584 family)